MSRAVESVRGGVFRDTVERPYMWKAPVRTTPGTYPAIESSRKAMLGTFRDLDAVQLRATDQPN